MLGETLSLFVEATGKDEALMRTAAREQEASRAASDSRILENARGGEATLAAQEGGSVGILQKVAELQTPEEGGLCGRVQGRR